MPSDTATERIMDEIMDGSTWQRGSREWKREEQRTRAVVEREVAVLDQEIATLRAQLEAAPHDSSCECRLLGGGKCTCWKSKEPTDAE